MGSSVDAPVRLSGLPAFRPHRLLANGHLQTLFATWPHRAPYVAVPHECELSDGDRLVLHDDRPATWQPGDRVALLVHGLTGSHASPYLVRIAAKLTAGGVRVWRMDMRGCGAGFRLARWPGHAGRSADVAAALDFVAQACPASAVTLVGFSLGGNIALRLAGEFADRPPPHLSRVIAVAPPIDIPVCSQNLRVGLNRLYDAAFVRSLLAQVRQKREWFSEWAAIPLTPRPRTLVEFDDRFTARLSGFSGVDEYYDFASSAPFLPRITVPTEILVAADDPLIPVRIFERAPHSSAVRLHVVPGGGHVGFFGRTLAADPDRRWLDWRIVEWVQVDP